MHNSHIVARRGEQLATPLDDGLLVLALDSGKYHTFNGMGARLWELLETPRPIQELTCSIMAEYDVPLEECRADLARFLDAMQRAHLIAIVNPTV